MANQDNHSGDNADVNSLLRISRFTKLYKLVKITRLFRLFKFMQNKNKVLNRITSIMRVGKAFERLAMFLVILLMLSHFVSCFWIFIARTFEDPNSDEIDSWIKSGEFEDYNMFELYSTSFYFSMTTITTVGYGDIGGNSTTERVVCIFLHLIGVLSYSFASGSLTSIIANFDSIN